MKEQKPLDVIEEFGRRRRRYHVAMLAAVLAWVLPFAASKLLVPVWIVVAVAVACAVTAWFATTSRRYRCPACGAKPVDEEGDETFARPKRCSTCGVRLSPEF